MEATWAVDRGCLAGTSVTVGAQGRHNKLINETGIIEPDPVDAAVPRCHT